MSLDIAAELRGEVGDRWVAALTQAAVRPHRRRRPLPRWRRGARGAGAPDGDDAADGQFDEEGDEGGEWPADPAVDEAVAFFRARGCALMLESMRAELRDFGVEFDCWFSETTLHEGGRLERVVDRLLESGEAYREGEAVWLRTTARGDDKDRVLIRSNGHPTYFAADIAYHENKLERGFEHLINIWGADHHGYVPRMKAAVEILAGRPGALEVIIGQLVNLLEEGELRQMSTRRGEMVTLGELIAGRRRGRGPLLPGHAFAGSDARPRHRPRAPAVAGEPGLLRAVRARSYRQHPAQHAGGHCRRQSAEEPEVFASPYERGLIKRLESFSSVAQDAAERRSPHRIAAYAQELAGDFHVFYKHCRVIGTEPAIGVVAPGPVSGQQEGDSPLSGPAGCERSREHVGRAGARAA